MKQYDDHLHMMESIGGSFVRSLAACWYSADSANRKKLEEAFSEIFDRYKRQFEEWKP